jgi:hypothetical protein
MVSYIISYIKGAVVYILSSFGILCWLDDIYAGCPDSDSDSDSDLDSGSGGRSRP